MDNGPGNNIMRAGIHLQALCPVLYLASLIHCQLAFLHSLLLFLTASLGPVLLLPALLVMYKRHAGLSYCSSLGVPCHLLTCSLDIAAFVTFVC